MYTDIYITFFTLKSDTNTRPFKILLRSIHLFLSSNHKFGNGHMQYYAMDAVAAGRLNTSATARLNNVHNHTAGEHNSAPVPGAFLDFTVDPDALSTRHKLPHLENFFSYFEIGNVGFLLFSGGYDYKDTKPYFEEGCAWLKEAKPAVAFIAGHWNDAGLGCSSQMDVPAVYEEIRGFDGCAQLDQANNLKYIMGHTHCNKVTTKDVGFMVAGQGMKVVCRCAEIYTLT